LIIEAGYEEQAQSYTLMSQTADQAADKAASGSMISAGIKAVAGLASLHPTPAAPIAAGIAALPPEA
jgi:hypothetical protein